MRLSPGRQRKPDLEIRLSLLNIVGHAAGRHKRDIDRSSAPLNVTQNVNARRDPFEERAAQGVDAAAHWCRRGVAQRTRRTEAPACGARAALGADDRGHCLCGLGGRDVKKRAISNSRSIVDCVLHKEMMRKSRRLKIICTPFLMWGSRCRLTRQEHMINMTQGITPCAQCDRTRVR